ncbi:hypothetical protein JS756_24270 [Streptomyces actuosus]|uniref:Uncharacterized protein n=1 Tax=Streptomyces actuosus TaxID=1885 RepID=A0ABS2VVV0_STRAS|nr:hypothetical protein [Streptomyces actuosus]MBN0047166.1 hypothetical protein [Streptomyces actuosus]
MALTDPVPRTCLTRGAEMDPLLTIASTEGKGSTKSWAPEGDQASDLLPPGVRSANHTRIARARGYDLQLHAYPASPDHPHAELVQ